MSEPKPRKKGKGPGGLGPTIGGILAGFDQEIMRRVPPTQELVKRGAPVRRVTGQDGSDLVIGLPEDLPEDGESGDPDPSRTGSTPSSGRPPRT